MRYANEFAYLDKRFGDAQEEVYRRAQQTTSIVERHVTPVSRIGPTDVWISRAVVFLRGWTHDYYLVTAAHVLDACEQGCVVELPRRPDRRSRGPHRYGTPGWENQG